MYKKHYLSLSGVLKIYIAFSNMHRYYREPGIVKPWRLENKCVQLKALRQPNTDDWYNEQKRFI